MAATGDLPPRPAFHLLNLQDYYITIVPIVLTLVLSLVVMLYSIPSIFRWVRTVRIKEAGFLRKVKGVSSSTFSFSSAGRSWSAAKIGEPSLESTSAFSFHPPDRAFVANPVVSIAAFTSSSAAIGSRAGLRDTPASRSRSYSGPQVSRGGSNGRASSQATIRPKAPYKRSPTISAAEHLLTRHLIKPLPQFHMDVGQATVIVFAWVVSAYLVFWRKDLRADPRPAGFTALAGIPIAFYMVQRNTPLAAVLGGQEKINFLHRWIGRIVFAAASLHGGYFIYKLAKAAETANHKEGSPFAQGYILAGIIAWTGTAILALTSLPGLRKRAWGLFLFCHSIGFIMLVVALIYHKPITRMFAFISSIMYGGDQFFRLLRTRYVSANLTPLGEDATLITVPSLGKGWSAGQHVYLRVVMGARVFESHPLTIANAPHGNALVVDGEGGEGDEVLDDKKGVVTAPTGPTHQGLTLVAKATGDWTRALHEASRSPQASSSLMHAGGVSSHFKTVNVFVEGPYGGLPMFGDLAEYESALILSGGSGVTFGMSTLEDVVIRSVTGKGRTRHVKFIWVVKEAETIDWFASKLSALVLLAASVSHLNLELFIHVTNEVSLVRGLTGLPPGVEPKKGRPSIHRALGAMLDLCIARGVDGDVVEGATSGRGGVAVAVCGPDKMVDDAREAVRAVPAKRVGSVGGIRLFFETFG